MDINAVLEENKILKQRVSELEEKLKKYTNPLAHQAFYEKNKEKIIKNIMSSSLSVICLANSFTMSSLL